MTSPLSSDRGETLVAASSPLHLPPSPSLPLEAVARQIMACAGGGGALHPLAHGCSIGMIAYGEGMVPASWWVCSCCGVADGGLAECVRMTETLICGRQGWQAVQSSWLLDNQGLRGGLAARARPLGLGTSWSLCICRDLSWWLHHGSSSEDMWLPVKTEPAPVMADDGGLSTSVPLLKAPST
jgi:hypothetical protein